MTHEEQRTARALVERNGRLFSEELGIDLSRNTPEPLFRWLCAALLMSARISHRIALDAARALATAGWSTAERMAESRPEDRARVLNRAGYARYDESTARMLGDAAERILADYSGDLRKLREAAGEDPARERERLKAFKGIGDVGADIFFREVQVIWPEHFPFLDAKARGGAKRLGLPDTADALAALVEREELPRLAVALVRMELDGSTPAGRMQETAAGEP